MLIRAKLQAASAVGQRGRSRTGRRVVTHSQTQSRWLCEDLSVGKARETRLLATGRVGLVMARE